jgi:saccharopine dehydrogenase-like NADP-dependent oxidoreductase
MAAIAGITKKNIKGQLTHVTLDVKKHAAVIPMFKELGLLPKTTLQKQRENGITVRELKDSLLEQIDELWSK